MTDVKTKMESLLFDNVTTYKSSYRGGQLKASAPTLYQEKPACERPQYKLLKGVHTLYDWKKSVPFDLMHRPRPILNTDPRTVQQKIVKPIDKHKERAQATRPRPVMTPAVSIDDITDPRAREILINDMYTSDMTRGDREAVTECSRIESPFPGLPAPANPIVLPKLQPPVVPPEWRMETIRWDSKQLRAHCDPTKNFWLQQIVLPKALPPVVPLEWRKESITWDKKQVRTYCHPTKNFWLKKVIPECLARNLK